MFSLIAVLGATRLVGLGSVVYSRLYGRVEKRMGEVAPEEVSVLKKYYKGEREGV